MRNPTPKKTHIAVGVTQTLQITRRAKMGVFVGYPAEGQRLAEEVLLPDRFVPRGAQPGDELKVFVYNDSEDRPIATTLVPVAEVGEFAAFDVVDITPHGAFLDWGLDKDLFAPFGEQHTHLSVGDRLVFYVSLDRHTMRVKASSKLGRFFDYEPEGLEYGQEMSALVFGENEIGFNCVVDGRYAGMLFRNQVYQDLRIGDVVDCYVHDIRDDGRLDLSVHRTGVQGIEDASAVILRALKQNNGFLALHDKSPPQDIRDALNISKKAFKKGLGGLYRERLVTLEEGGVRLVH